jgi:hypothetical protein
VHSDVERWPWLPPNKAMQTDGVGASADRQAVRQHQQLEARREVTLRTR